MTDQMQPDDMQEEPGMSEDELSSYIQRAVETAQLYEQDELTADNQRAIEYFFGVLSDVPSEPGRSRAVSKDVSDVIGGLMPQIMRVFTSTDRLWLFEPQTPQDVEAARQATDYVNFVFFERCDGYRALYDAVHDGLLLRNGVLKVWWDDTPEYDVAEYRGLNEMQAQDLVSADDVEVLAASEAEPEMVSVVDPATGQEVQVSEPRLDLKLKTKVRDGKPCIETVPPEDFLIERGARGLHDTRMMAHRFRITRGELISQGFDPDKVEQIPEYSGFYSREEEAARQQDRSFDLARQNVLDRSSEYVEVFETYVRLDMNGDGVAEWVRGYMGGSGGGAVLLHYDEWDDETPFEDVAPDPVPHRWLGRSVWDHVADIQRQKTVLKRDLLNNLYFHNNPTPVYNRQAVRDDESVQALTTRDGSAVEVDGDPRASVMYDVVPFVGDRIMQVFDYLDAEIEMRTGLSKVAQGMQTDVLQNQSATAVMQATSAAHARVELYTRNIAQGIQRLGQKLYRLIAQNMDRPDVIRLRGDFVEVDPRGWAASMNVSVNTGLGTGSRDRDAVALQVMGAYGQNMLQTFGQTPVFGLPQARELGVMMAEAQGIKNFERIIGSSDDEIQAWQQQQAEAAASQPDPEVAKAQLDAQVEAQKAQLKAQVDQQEAAAKIQADQQEMAEKAALEREKLDQERAIRSTQMQQDAELKRAEIEANIRLREMQIERELALKERQIGMELELKREMMRRQAAADDSDASGAVGVGGEPG